MSKLLIVLTLTALFAVPAAAQSERYPNELPGLELYSNSRFNVLVPYQSTAEEVQAVYGGKCVNSSACELNEDWTVGFFYRGPERYGVAPAIADRFLNLTFRPRKRVSLAGVKFPADLEVSYGGRSHLNATLRFYEDKYGLKYIVIDDSKDPRYKSGDLLEIEYGPSAEEIARHEPKKTN